MLHLACKMCPCLPASFSRVLACSNSNKSQTFVLNLDVENERMPKQSIEFDI